MRFHRTTVAFVAVLVLLIVGIWLGKVLAVNPPEYSAVYMATGDMYFGKFKSWPQPRLTDAWHLDRGPNGEMGISPMKNVVWGPGSTIYLNRSEIVFWAPLRSDSPLVQAFEGKVTQLQQPQGGNAGASGTSGSQAAPKTSGTEPKTEPNPSP